MENLKHIRRRHRNFGLIYPTSLWQKWYSIFIAPLLFTLIFFVILEFFSILPQTPERSVPFNYLGLALLATLARLAIAYFFAAVLAVPLAILINKNPIAEHILLPLFDIIQSIPTLAFFPIIVLFFIKFNFFNGAAIFILFLSMLWNIVFSVVGGLKAIPADIKFAAEVFGIRGVTYIRKVLLPAVTPHLITGSLLAWAQGWNIIIVAEVLHTYIPGGNISQDLFGIGSILVNAAARGQNNIFIVSILFMIIAIGFLNFFIWQKLLRYAEKFKFE